MLSLQKTIGITGGIGCGKSIICRILRCNGETVYDCDSEAKRLMETNEEIKSQLKSKLGVTVYTSDGKLNKQYLADKLFNNEAIRNFVNGVVHKAVREDIIKKRKEEKGFFFIESAILASSRLASICDSIWVVEAPLNTRIKRICNRDNSPLDIILKKIESQNREMSLLGKYNGLIIENDGITPILSQVLQLINKNNNKTFYELC